MARDVEADTQVRLTEFPMQAGVLGVLRYRRLWESGKEHVYVCSSRIVESVCDYVAAHNLMKSPRPGNLRDLSILAEREGTSYAAIKELLIDVCICLSLNLVIGLQGEFHVWSRDALPTGKLAHECIRRSFSWEVICP